MKTLDPHFSKNLPDLANLLGHNLQVKTPKKALS